MVKQQEKKKFYPIQIPLLKKEVELYGRENQLEGRHVKIDLTNSLKGKGLEIKFIVKESNGELISTPTQAYLQGFYIRRMLRKGTDYVEDSFLTKSKDHRIRVKPFMITRNRVSREVLNGLRIKAQEEITKYTKDKTFEELVKDILDGKLQKEILPALKKIYPLGLCEIRFIGIEDLKEHEKYEAEQEVEEIEIKEEETNNKESNEEETKEEKEESK
jgi:ribosomal protein S3AE